MCSINIQGVIHLQGIDLSIEMFDASAATTIAFIITLSAIASTASKASACILNLCFIKKDVEQMKNYCFVVVLPTPLGLIDCRIIAYGAIFVGSTDNTIIPFPPFVLLYIRFEYSMI